MIKRPTHSGFALLLTLIVVSVVLAIGLTILNVTLKQYTLSVTGRESEIAFHVANSMVECFQYQRFATPEGYTSPGRPPLSCESFANQTLSPGEYDNVMVNFGGGHVHHFFYRFESNSANTCGEVSAYVLEPTNGDIDNFPFDKEGLETVDCEQGYTCTVVYGRGFNRACNDLDSLRTVQREMTATF